MKSRTLVIVAFTTLVGCSSPGLPATMPDATETALKLYATSATFPLVTELTGVYTDRYITFETRSGTLRAALTSLLEGDSPYFISSHIPATEVVPLWAAPIAQDGIAVIVNPANPVTDMTPDVLREVYQGRVGNWRALGGQNLDLVVFSREADSDTRAEFERLVMGQRRTTLAARLVTSSETMVSEIAATPGGIGYVSMAYLNSGVRALTVNGIAITPENVLQNHYPLRSTIFVVGMAEPQGAYRAFFGWMQSPEGQQVVGRRYVPLSGEATLHK
jgi:phosphate transport system substrate-binding protein